MEDYLELDLNEIASKAIKEKIEALELRLKSVSDNLSKEQLKINTMNSEAIKQKLSVIISGELSTNEKLELITKLFESAHIEQTKIKVHGENLNEEKFKSLALPMIKYLCENYHPHVSVIITPTSAELLEGLKSVGYIDDYIRD